MTQIPRRLRRVDVNHIVPGGQHAKVPELRQLPNCRPRQDGLIRQDNLGPRGTLHDPARLGSIVDRARSENFERIPSQVPRVEGMAVQNHNLHAHSDPFRSCLRAASPRRFGRDKEGGAPRLRPVYPVTRRPSIIDPPQEGAAFRDRPRLLRRNTLEVCTTRRYSRAVGSRCIGWWIPMAKVHIWLILCLAVALPVHSAQTGVTTGIRAVTRPSADTILSFVQPGRIAAVLLQRGRPRQSRAGPGPAG